MPRLTHRASKIVQQLIVDLTFGSLPSADSAWPVVPDIEPDSPDNVITVYNIEPDLLGNDMLTASQVERDRVQIRVRSNDRKTQKARELAEELEKVIGQTVTVDSQGYLINMVLRESGPLYLGKDKPQSGRFLFTINFSLDIKET